MDPRTDRVEDFEELPIEEARKPVNPLISEGSNDQFNAAEQIELAKLVIKTDEFNKPVTKVGGIDVTFIENYQGNTVGVAVLVVLEYPKLEKTLYEDSEIGPCEIPYKSGFLGYREFPFAKILIARLKEKSPKLIPDILLVDGSGIYHERRCGFASQLGVLMDIPTIGVAKSFLKIKGVNHEDFESEYSSETKDVVDETGVIIAKALYNTKTKSKHPLYVSIGHRISLETAETILRICQIYTVPEPIRRADKSSRVIAFDMKYPKVESLELK